MTRYDASYEKKYSEQDFKHERKFLCNCMVAGSDTRGLTCETGMIAMSREE